MDGEVIKYLSQLNQKIRKGCTAHISKTGRLYYMNHETKTVSWLPPVESWDSGGTSLPYGWEAAFDRDGKTYFVNHVNRTTTNEDPRKDSDEEPPMPREVELVRDPQKGFGFVAGSEKPVIVRFVTEGGPSEGKLLPGDQILQINNEDVMKSPRERVIELVRSCKQSVKMLVSQPYSNNTTRKSALLTAAKKAKLKTNPSRVRFAEGVVINGSPLYCPSPMDSSVPFMPNVLKVFLENGQTKSFKYDSTTTVQDVLNVLQEKLSLTSLEHFSLVVEHIRTVRRNKLFILNPKDTLAKIAARPGAHNLRCLFRITFVPRDIYEFMQKDPVAFDYLFVQSCNDVVQERFAPELKYDVALRLAALHLQQHALASGIQGKLTVKTIEREFGLEKFVPASLLDTMKRKELLKLLSQLMKQNQALSGPGQKQLSSVQAKFHYLKIVSDLPSYGAKSFMFCAKNSNMDAAVLIGPRIGISQISTIRNIAPLNLCQFGDLECIEVDRDDDFSYKVRVRLRHPEKECLYFNFDEREIDEFVLVIERYYSQLVGDELPVYWEGRDPEPVEMAPSFHSRHTVEEAPWSYVPFTKVDQPDDDLSILPRLRCMDLSIPPPPYVPCEERQLSRSNSRDQFSIATSPTSVDHNMNEMRALVAALSSSPNFHKVKSRSDSNLTKDQDGMQCSSNDDSDGMPRQGTAMADQPDTICAQLQSQRDGQCLGIDMHSVVSMELLEENGRRMQRHDTSSNGVIDRVTEMSRIVNDAELYLLRDNTKLVSIEESRGLLLPPSCEDFKFDDLPLPSESEAESTPTNSPTHTLCAGESPKTVARKMFSSFGLHTPHLLASIDQQSEDVEELLRQLQASTDMPLEESSLCLDPDIIDLTIVPPPNCLDVDFSQITPDVDSKSFLSFQGSETEENVSGTSDFSDSPKQNYQSTQPTSYDSCSSIATSSIHSSSGYESSGDSGTIHEEDEDDLAAFIIPPPPPSSGMLEEEQNRVLARFREVAEEVRNMMSQGHEGKYAETMNSVSKFCTMPRRHDDSHRPSLSSLASMVTPSREKAFLHSFSVAAKSDAEKRQVPEGVGNFSTFGPRINGVDPPRRPPRMKRTTSENAEITVGKNFTNGFEVHGNSVRYNGSVSRTLSIDGIKSTAIGTNNIPSQELQGNDPNHLPEQHPGHQLNGMAPKLSNGHEQRYNGDQQPLSLPEASIHECRICNGSNKGCSCQNLGQFKSYHQSLPRNKIASGMQTFTVPIANGFVGGGVFNDAQQEIADMVVSLESTCQLRIKECDAREQMSDAIKLAKVRETLMNESRQFVTASKLFVKSITESSDCMEENLSACLVLLDRIFAVGELVVKEMDEPFHIRTLNEKLKEMALAYSRTVCAAQHAAAGSIPNSNMAGLMHQATSLATTLTTLMRTLRTFSSP